MASRRGKSALDCQQEERAERRGRREENMEEREQEGGRRNEGEEGLKAKIGAEAAGKPGPTPR